MSKVKESEVSETPQPVLNQNALGIHYDGKLNQWVLTHLKYDPESLVAGEIVKIPCGATKDMAIERFKILAIDLNMVN